MVTVLHHPLVDHRMVYLRDANTKPKLFRELVSELTVFLVYEALRDLLRTKEVTVETPLTTTVGKKVADEIIVPILRAGMGMLATVSSVQSRMRTLSRGFKIF